MPETGVLSAALPMLRTAAQKLLRGGHAAAHAAASVGLQPRCGAAAQAQRVAQLAWQRPYSAGEEGEGPDAGSPRVAAVADQILQLNLLEVSDLTELLKKRLNIQAPFGAPMGMMGMMSPASAAGAHGRGAARPGEAGRPVGVGRPAGRLAARPLWRLKRGCRRRLAQVHQRPRPRPPRRRRRPLTSS